MSGYELSLIYIGDVVWKPTLFDRMQATFKTFAIDKIFVPGYIYH